jgi:drug/metabolite transporter (DMT)-like permease
LPAVNEGKVSLSDYVRKFMPVAFLTAYGLVAGNLAYSYISLSYIQMVKAITPVPLLLMAFAFGREKPSVAQLLIVMVVSFGVVLSSLGELKFSWIGFTLQV